MNELLLTKLFTEDVSINTPTEWNKVGGEPTAWDTAINKAHIPEHSKQYVDDTGKQVTSKRYMLIERTALLTEASEVTYDGETFNILGFKEIKDRFFKETSHFEVWLT